MLKQLSTVVAILTLSCVASICNAQGIGRGGSPGNAARPGNRPGPAHVQPSPGQPSPGQKSPQSKSPQSKNPQTKTHRSGDGNGGSGGGDGGGGGDGSGFVMPASPGSVSSNSGQSVVDPMTQNFLGRWVGMWDGKWRVQLTVTQ